MTATVLPPPGTEALDARGLDAAVARATLRDIAFTNRWLGGHAAAAAGLARLLADAPHERPFTVLDVGAGMGDVVRALARRRSGGPPLRPVALDHHREAARLCRAAGVPAVVADVAALPLPDRSVDVVLATLVLHHFTRPAAVALVRRLDRLARWGVVVTDLVRSRAAVLALRAVAALVHFHPATRHDGEVSVRRGFTRAELRDLLAEAGVRAAVWRRWTPRLVAVWRTEHADG